MPEKGHLIRKLTYIPVTLLVAVFMAVAPMAVVSVDTATAQARPPQVEPLITKGTAEFEAFIDADALWGNGPVVTSCKNTGVNKAGSTQWACDGYFEGGPNHFYIGLGPYSELLEYYKYS